MKERFDELTDLVEHAQSANPTPLQNPASSERQVENVAGEMITLDDKLRPDTF